LNKTSNQEKSRNISKMLSFKPENKGVGSSGRCEMLSGRFEMLSGRSEMLSGRCEMLSGRSEMLSGRMLDNLWLLQIVICSCKLVCMD